MVGELLLLRVREGEIADAGSWVYAWIGASGVVYVGATGLHPATRTWLHLHDVDPDVGRLLARFPEVAREELDVLALRLPEDADRQEVRHAVVTRLGERGLLAERHVCDPPAEPSTSVDADRLVEAVAEHLRS
ncbi:MAG: hypothetical protein H0V68_05690 [Actinobacteria bacterium]|nr:hypothetical protein [Actinomycetota bacterium]